MPPPIAGIGIHKIFEGIMRGGFLVFVETTSGEIRVTVNWDRLFTIQGRDTPKTMLRIQDDEDLMESVKEAIQTILETEVVLNALHDGNAYPELGFYTREVYSRSDLVVLCGESNVYACVPVCTKRNNHALTVVRM
jgi:hypothetical protein